eukprot:gene44032-53827_t
MSTEVAQNFRIILRRMQKMPSFQGTSSPLRQHVIQQGRKVADPQEAQRLRAVAHSAATMLRDIQEAKYLRYLDSGEKLDQRDKIRNTAARVGLSVPFFSDELDKKA